MPVFRWAATLPAGSPTPSRDAITMKKTVKRPEQKMFTRQRALNRKKAAWRRRALQGMAGAVVAAGFWGSGLTAHAQMGQTAMAPAGGVVNRAVQGLSNLNQYGPGYLYYGVNAADRGLGYRGSYMTVGGFIPYAEDDLGGFWSADLRGHLSVYGGFFSNVGLVRKQLVGGTLLGVGVYWDYDGDLNQYPTGGAPGTEVFGQFGHVYQQVGVSGEWLTDYGNLRSNGYMPVGTTAYTAGYPGSPFYQNYIMCQYGLDAALGGADLEVGAYIPALAQWAGMISVGGYALGNTVNEWQFGSNSGQAIVPWFGGVYTRLDMTFLEGWDFSLQYNNDPVFDSTGFARLTYRMGGSRRRTVPDQMEQPMMRNEHIVRDHITPVVAGNRGNGNLPWRVIHVNNAAAAGGNGTYEAPFQSIAEGNAAATNAWDIVLVDPGTGTSLYYDTPFQPLAANQYFIGNGAPFLVPTDTCGLVDISTLSGVRPLLSNPTGASIVATNGLVVNNFNIQGSEVGILGVGNLSSGIPRPAGFPYASPSGGSFVTNVAISGTQLPNQTGVFLNNTTGDISFQATQITDMTNGGFVVSGGNPNVDFDGTITSDVNTNGGFTSPIISITDTTGGTIDINDPSSTGKIVDNGGEGILIAGNTGGTIEIGNASLTESVETAVLVEDSGATISLVDSQIIKSTPGASIRVDGGNPTFAYTNSTINDTGGYMLEVLDTLAGSVLLDSPAGQPFVNAGPAGKGILVDSATGDVTVLGAEITSVADGIGVFDSPGNQVFNDITILGASGPAFAGVNLQNNTGSSSFANLNITTTNATGFLAQNDNIINVTGNSTVDSTGAPAVSLTNVTDANINFKTVTSTNSIAQGVFIDNTNGKFDVSGGVTITNPATNGFVVQNSADLEVNIPTLTAVTAAGLDGIRLLNNNQASGTEMTFGEIDVSTGNPAAAVLGGRGVVIQSTTAARHGKVNINDGTVDAFGGGSLDINNAEVAINLESAASDSSAGNGLNLVDSDGSVEIQQTFVTAPDGNGINVVDNEPGFTADFGSTFITGIDNGAIGVNITNATDPIPDTKTSFDSLSVTTTDGTGMLTKNGGMVNFNTPATITAAGGPAINLENTTGTTNNVTGSGFTFLNLTSVNSAANGVRLADLNSDLSVTGTTTISGASGESISITDTQTPPGVYSIDFNDVQITSRRNIGLFVDGINGQVEVANLNIDNANNTAGDAVLISNTTNPADPTGTGSGRVYINGGTISNSNGNGIEVVDGVASISGVSVTGSTGQGILIRAGAGQESTVAVQNSTITGAAGLDGVQIQSTGDGTVNATIGTNLIDAQLNPLEAIVFDTPGTINLNAFGNFGTGGGPPLQGDFVLNNQGGTLSIEQATTADLSTSNNGVVVTVPASPVSVNGSTPTPPPPTP